MWTQPPADRDWETNKYKENYNRIFKKEKTLSEMLEEGFKKEQDGIAEETN